MKLTNNLLRVGEIRMLKNIKYATKIVEAWIKGKSSSGEAVARDMKIVFQAAIDTMEEAEKKINQN
jgi:hypothetical protein